MHDMESVTDVKLRKHGLLARYDSLKSARISLADLPITAKQVKELDKWRDKFYRLLPPKSRILTRIPDVHGPQFILDNFIDGEIECFRRKVSRKKPVPFKIGINLSSAAGSWHMNAMRGGAVLAFCDFLQKNGQSYQIEATYGNGRSFRAYGDECHVRVSIVPYSITVSHVALSDKSTEVFGEKLVNPLAMQTMPGGRWHGGYRLWEYQERDGINEYDFVLDRIETDDIPTEEKRILDRLKALALID